MKDAVTKFVSSIPGGLWEDALAVARHLRGSSDVTVATHIDADGVAAASIAKSVLERLGARHEVLFFKKLT